MTTKTQLGDILAAQRLSQVPELHGLRVLSQLIVWVSGRVDGEDLVMAESVDGAVVEEAGVVHGTVVDDLHQGIVFVCDGCVVDVD